MKRGSALLIVLGMLAFLVISAVAFSVFMRTSRLPSSYLLRMSVSRNLAKAALAEAMDEIDRAVANNPHPGVVTSFSVNGGGNGQAGQQTVENRNQWRERIFLGTNMLIDVKHTVATLTLEGLAYIPPPLINEARYYSRRSPAGAWHQFGFDSGRFAFTAIDVSDYFDVHRVQASLPRSSAADSRVTLAHLFEKRDHAGTTWVTDAEAWDEFMDHFVSDSAASPKDPLVSWADLNLAIWDSANGLSSRRDQMSPWCRFVENGTEFVKENADEKHVLSNLVFVTDSWFPKAKEAVESFNLADRNDQPFIGLDLRNKTAYSSRTFDDVVRAVNAKTIQGPKKTYKWSEIIGPMEALQLCDYLDADSVPTSIAAPTTERAPMIVGVSLRAGSELKYELTPDIRFIEKPAGQNQKKRCYKITTYTLKLTGELRPMVGVVYPFLHSREDENEEYEIQVAATLTIAPKDENIKKLRLGNATDTSPAICSWDNNKLEPTEVAFDSAGGNNSIVVMRSDKKPLPINRTPKTPKDCLKPIDFEFGAINFKLVGDLGESSYASGDQAIKEGTLRLVQEVDAEDHTQVINDKVELSKGFLPANNLLLAPFKSTANEIGDETTFEPVVQLWVRITNKAGNLIDLVPATPADDNKRSELLSDLMPKSRPLLRFSDSGSAMDVHFSRQWCEGFNNAIMTISPAAYVADDPRFNHAPESLAAVEDLTDEVQNYWLAKCTSPQLGGEDPIKDIFMETSDAGYLQSKYELAYLLDIIGLDSGSSDDVGALGGGGYNGQARDFGNLAAKNVMWETYSPWDDSIFEELPIINGRDGQRVCPYTPDTAVMMAALANTPRDWWAASTNDDSSVKQTMLSSLENSLKYTWSKYSSATETKVEWGNLERLARTLIREFRNADQGDWKTAYKNMAVSGALFSPLEENVDLYDIDCKYLYGFWRDCFEDPRQQLFLIFVRAEPLMMGGGEAGRTPPMLASRAVALVWRDPTRTNNNAPHRMRVLFYRPLE